MTSPITTHVLNTSTGKPAEGVSVTLEIQRGSDWKKIASGVTNRDGRISDLLAATIVPGVYRLTFAAGEYFKTLNVESFCPNISVEFVVKEPGMHYHVPLLLSPFGYSTYRGS